MITAETHNDKTSYTAVSRGVSYNAFPCGDQWFVSSHRVALGRRHIGGGKYYPTLQAVAAGCKAFAGLDALVAGAA